MPQLMPIRQLHFCLICVFVAGLTHFLMENKAINSAPMNKSTFVSRDFEIQSYKLDTKKERELTNNYYNHVVFACVVVASIFSSFLIYFTVNFALL
jgi:hypothetical protein